MLFSFVLPILYDHHGPIEDKDKRVRVFEVLIRRWYARRYRIAIVKI